MFVVLAATAAPAGAATIVVTDTDELGACSPRKALTDIELGTDFFCLKTPTSPAHGIDDTIILQGGQTYPLTFSGLDNNNGVGDLDIKKPVTITATGSGLATIDGKADSAAPADKDRAIDVLGSIVGGPVVLNRLKITGGDADDCGGGGILVNHQTTITDSLVTANKTHDGPCSPPGSQAGPGGGIVTYAALTLKNSAITSNMGGIGTHGGGLAVTGTGSLLAENLTVAGNSAAGSFNPVGLGGGIVLEGTGSSILNNVTVAGNSAAGFGTQGGGIAFVSGAPAVSNSVVAGNTLLGGSSVDCSGTFPSAGHNYLLPGCDGTPHPTDLTGTAPGLGPRAENGGFTPTLALDAGSPLIDRGAGCPATDQRGVARPGGPACDIGAFEIAGVTPPATPATPGPTGQRAAALKKCKKKRKKARKKCRKKAAKLPV